MAADNNPWYRSEVAKTQGRCEQVNEEFNQTSDKRLIHDSKTGY